MGTLPEWWTGPYPEVASTNAATDYLDELGADLTRREEDGKWTLATGEQDLITAETEAELDSFVLGFALAHLIVERHGLIGRRLPHPREKESQEDGGGGDPAEATGASEDAGDADQSDD